MTASQKLDAQELREKIFERDGWKCRNCGKSIYWCNVPQLAHRIAQTKANIEKYGEEIIHHPLNTASVCCLGCNSAMNIGFDPVATESLVDEIIRALQKDKDIV